ncbi:unnamed protein product, partial [marine sediment metagenome]
DAFELDIPTSNTIRWIASLDALMVGTSGDEWRIRATSIDAALTPTNFNIRQQTARGCRNIQALEVNEAVLFVDYVGRKVRELTYSDEKAKFVSPDLTALAEHITEGGITSHAHQRNPDSIVWCTLSDGTLLSMTYEREQDVVAWARHLTGLTQVDSTTSTSTYPAAGGYKITYISQNGAIWGIPVTDRTLIFLSGDARDVGGGIVALPMTGQPFSAGQTVRIEGTTNYDGEFTLLSGDAEANEILIEDTYVAETFDGTETVVQNIALSVGTLGKMAQDSSGNLYYGYDVGISKISIDGTIDNTYIVPDGGWPAESTEVRGVVVSNDSTYLYVVVRQQVVATVRFDMYKFQLSDGSQVWKVTTGVNADGYDADVDEDDNLYVCKVEAHGNLGKYA